MNLEAFSLLFVTLCMYFELLFKILCLVKKNRNFDHVLLNVALIELIS